MIRSYIIEPVIIFAAVLIMVFIAFDFVGLKETYVKDPVVGSAKAGPADIYPNSSYTLGALNPDITQATLNITICNKSWSTKSIRPAVSYTNKLKINQIKLYGYQDTVPSDYEEDHLISLELGGNPTDSHNLWPERYNSPSLPSGGAKTKDTVENYLHKEVCDGSITLQEAQRQIVTDWYAVYLSMKTKVGGLSNINNNDEDDN